MSKMNKHDFLMKSAYFLEEMRDFVERVRHDSMENGWADPEKDEWYSAIREARDSLYRAWNLVEKEASRQKQETDCLSPESKDEHFILFRELVGKGWEDVRKMPGYEKIETHMILVETDDLEDVSWHLRRDIEAMCVKWPTLGMKTENYGDSNRRCRFIGTETFGVRYTLTNKL